MKIWHRDVGPFCPVYVIAEIGSNWLPGLDTAIRLQGMAEWAGADAVKYQAFKADAMVPRDHPDWDGYKQCELPYEWLPQLREDAHARGMGFICSLFDPADVSAIAPLLDAVKIASAEATYTPLLEAVAKTGKPVILSTGMSITDDVYAATDTIYKVRKYAEIGVLHCVAAYPAPSEDMNLMVVKGCKALRMAGAVPGLSDHTADPYAAPLMAAALGACIVEKHLALSRNDPSPDASFSIEPHELKALCTSLHQAHLMLGDGVKRIMPSERPSLSDRRTLVNGKWLRGYGA